MKNYLLLSFLMLWSTQLFADSVRLLDVSIHEAYALSGSRYTLYTDEPSGDATSETAPMTIYVPTGNTAQVLPPQNEFFYQSRDGKSVLDVAVASRNSMAIIFPLRVNVGVTQKYISLAAKINGAWRLVGQDTNLYSNYDSTAELSISPYEICTTFALSGSINPCATGSVYTTEILTYAFVTDQSLSQADTVTPSNFTGVYFNLKLSNNVPKTIVPLVSGLRIGDRRATLQFSSNAVLSNAKFVRVYSFGDNDPAIPEGGETIGSQTTGSLLAQEITYSQSGEAVARDLINGTRYFLSIVMIDKYGFATYLSKAAEANPQAIEELLKANSCFLLTAGFGENHPVIDYFRHFRDSVLMNSAPGRIFVSTYYELAPKYALLIYQHEFIRASIRAIAWTLYYIFNNILLIGLALSVFYLGFLLKKRLKNRQSL